MVKNYYGVRLNIPWEKADAIKSLVPDGAPMSGTLITILLDVAKQRGYQTPETDGEVVLLRRQQVRLAKRVDVLEERLDYLARGKR